MGVDPGLANKCAATSTKETNIVEILKKVTIRWVGCTARFGNPLPPGCAIKYHPLFSVATYGMNSPTAWLRRGGGFLAQRSLRRGRRPQTSYIDLPRA